MKRFEYPILVTRPHLPDLSEFTAGFFEIWRNRWLTKETIAIGGNGKELVS